MNKMWHRNRDQLCADLIEDPNFLVVYIPGLYYY